MESSTIQSARNAYPVLFMFAEMQRLGLTIHDELDLVWEDAIYLYSKFETSEYNNQNHNEYDCITDFLTETIKQ